MEFLGSNLYKKNMDEVGTLELKSVAKSAGVDPKLYERKAPASPTPSQAENEGSLEYSQEEDPVLAAQMQECRRLMKFDFITRGRGHRREFLLDLAHQQASQPKPEVNLLTGETEEADLAFDPQSNGQRYETIKKECELIGLSFERFAQDQFGRGNSRAMFRQNEMNGLSR
jgi:hypothetical protein